MSVMREISKRELEPDEATNATLEPSSTPMAAAMESGGSTNEGSTEGERPQGDLTQNFLLDQIIEDVERKAIKNALAAAGGQRNKAAELMGISRSRLYRRMEALGIDPKANE